MQVHERDLTPAARIRNAALEGFARDGVEATSIRDVADAANVSAGLVQYHFKTKADLERTVNEYVIEIASRAYEDFEKGAADATTDERLSAMGDAIANLVRDHSSALLYVMRSAARGEEAGLEIFDALLAFVRTQVERLEQEGVVRDEADRLWATLHVVVWNLGAVMLEPAINRHLPAPLRDRAQLQRWNRSTTDLLLHGLVKP